MGFDDYVVGYRGEFTRVVTEHDNEMFAALSGDHNPVHFRDDVARRAGFERRICNGFVTESRIAAALVSTFGSAGTIVVAMEKNTTFLKPVYMGDVITATVEVVAAVQSLRALKIRAACFNQAREQVAATLMTVRLMSVADDSSSGDP